MFRTVDWAALAQQKETLAALRMEPQNQAEQSKALNLPASAEDARARTENLDGLLHFLDALQDAAKKDGFPVVFLTEEGR